MNMFSYPADVQYGLRQLLCDRIGDGFAALEDTALQAHLIACETPDFHWSHRVRERYLGVFADEFDDDIELDRIAILSFLQGRWFVGIALVDGEGAVHHLYGSRQFDDIGAANRAYDACR